ncbi:hypothetical protein OG403_31710 [Kitasatospora sp. NBC_01266]|nr:hypothetical protein [Kitasatospora sp. NBC_01266]
MQLLGFGVGEGGVRPEACRRWTQLDPLDPLGRSPDSVVEGGHRALRVDGDGDGGDAGPGRAELEVERCHVSEFGPGLLLQLPQLLSGDAVEDALDSAVRPLVRDDPQVAEAAEEFGVL